MSVKSKVLIVEDDAWLAEHYIRILSKEGYDVWSVPHALAAIDHIDSRRPDVILLDVLLTGSTAFALLHELRSHVDIGNIPVILCTNTAAALAYEDMTLYGVRQVLDKATVTPDEVIHAIKKVLL